MRSTQHRPRNGPAPAPATGPLRQWFSLTNLGGNAADLWIYDEIGGWGVTADMLVSRLAELNVAAITVHLNSPGGDVFDGIAILNALRDHPATITVKVDALAASIASVIAQAANKIIMGRNSMMMIHNASGFAMGEASDMRKMADLLDQTTANIASIYAERAGGTVKSWLKVMAEETWYSADDAVAAGLADEVAPLATEREAGKQAARFDLAAYAHAPKILPAAALAELTDTDPEPEPDPPVPTEPEVVPVPTPPPRPRPVPLPLPDGAFAAAIRAAVTAAVPVKPVWDPDLFRGAIGVVTGDVPTNARPAPAPVLPGLVAADPPPPVPEQWSGAGLLRAAVALVTHDVPDPEPRPHTPPPAGGFDPDVFHLAIREARR